MDVAQTAVNCPTQNRFKNSNLPLKIDIIESIHFCPDSQPKSFEDLDYDAQCVTSIGRAHRRLINSQMSPDFDRHFPKAHKGKDRMGMSGSRDKSRHSSDTDSTMNLVVSSSEGPYCSKRGPRVVTGVHDFPSHMRLTADHDSSYSHRNPVNFRKRGRSPGFGDDFDKMNDFGEEEFGGRRCSYRCSHGKGSQRFSSTSSNGDSEFQTKRPRNCSDACQYHKQHRNCSRVEKVSYLSLPHGGHETSMGHSSHRDRDYESEPQGNRSGEHSSGSGGGHQRREDENKQDNDHTQKTFADSNSAELKDRVGDVSLPSPPPSHPCPSLTDMMSYEAAHSTLKLRSSTAPTSFSDGLGQTESKPDLELQTLTDLSQAYPVIWDGNLVLENTGFPTRMHLIGGDTAVAELLVKAKEPGEEMNALRITQKVHLEPPCLEEVKKCMANAGHCILLALPGAIPSLFSDGEASNSSTQLRPLKSLMSYLQQKKTAGIVSLNTVEDVRTAEGGSGLQQKVPTIGVLHIFPPCEFS